ncbi:hypothetical protein OG488_06745 [Streptomyces sp. NBC_01460]|uniref:hypothetical protein n=1 Tax=Streptomyces sp. NBC_01460 TaxID=2903875 RepID=UPI002E313557|nr:hypothetical protein [Streptomyces sp. NBC_01460]
MDDGCGAAERLARGTPLGGALDTTAPASWVTLDAEVRALSHRLADALPTRHRLRSLPPGPPSSTEESLIALALCHPDGRVRAAALDRAAGAPALRPLLVIRCADWVGPVRDRARALLADVSAELAPLAGLVLLLARRDRGGFALAALDRALRDGPGAGVVPLLTSGDRAVRRFGHGVAIDRRLLTPVELARTAAFAPGDVRLQALCAEAALSRTGDDDEGVVDLLLSARSGMVRSAGVTGLRRTGRHDEAASYLADRSAIVRACARYVLRQAGVDPLPLYRSMCAEPAEHPAAAAGLGECGACEEADTLWALTAHPLPAVRAHAVAGLRALDAVRSDRVEPLLDDPVPAVVRAACRALLPYAAGLDRERLRARLAPDRLRAARTAARRLLDAQDLARTRGLSGL